MFSVIVIGHFCPFFLKLEFTVFLRGFHSENIIGLALSLINLLYGSFFLRKLRSQYFIKINWIRKNIKTMGKNRRQETRSKLKSITVMQVLISWMDTSPLLALSLRPPSSPSLFSSAIHLQHLSAFLSLCLYIFLSILRAVPHPN